MRKLAALIGCSFAILFGCSGSDTQTTSSSGTGASGGGGSGGGSGGMMDSVCVASPVAAALPGTDDCPAPLPGDADAFDAALAAATITRCSVRFWPDHVALSGWPSDMLFDKRRLPDFTPLHRGPLRLPGYARETRSWLEAAGASAHPVSDALAALSVRRGHAFPERCLDLVPAAPDPMDTTPLATAVLTLDADLGVPGDEAALRAAAMNVPLSLQIKLARVVFAMGFAVSEVRAALGTEDLTDLRYFARSHSLFLPSVSAYSTTAESIAKLDTVDIGRITEAAILLARVIEEARFEDEPAASFAAFEAPTPIGSIVVHDAANDTYLKASAADGALLLFDLGGDDTYEIGAGASDEKHPVSIAIDVRGKDHYGYAIKADTADGDLLPSDGKGRYHSATTPDQDWGPITLSRVARQGAGLAGIGMLFDLGVEGDVYRSLAISQGFAAMGTGVLYDAGGDDDYAAEIGAQGSAMFGIGLLLDRSGVDHYASFASSQGFGGTYGAGALVDLDGDDDYVVDVGDPAQGGHPLYYSPQRPGTGNSSMSQGAAQGRRPQSASDAAYMAGGFGLLFDRAGDDHYLGSVFAQGVGYWQGLGVLIDGSGADTYDALWYIQGSAAHFALAMFLEGGGDDQYNQVITPAATSIGLGHDFSAGVHLDEGGDDTYRAPGLSLGSGNINGIGCFVNAGGNDTYDAAGDPTFGTGNYSAEAPFGEPRQDAPTIGIFVDAGGTDTYLVAGMSRALDDTTWSDEPQPYPPPDMVTTQFTCGADDGNGTVALP